jgi:transcription elongation factor Elf1
MSIDKSEGYYYLTCDQCGIEHDDVFDELYDAVEAKKEDGWTSIKVHGYWQDLCPDCRKLMG